MKIKVAQVESTSDLFESGYIWVRDDEKGFPYAVKYTSPFLSIEGGMVAMPPDNAIVLVCQPDNSNTWYYLGSTTDINLAQAFSDQSPIERTVLPDSKLYRADGSPRRVTFKDSNNNGLVISNEKNNKFTNFSVVLETATGKGLKLTDSPKVDTVCLENEHGDCVKISSNAVTGASMGGRSIQIECIGNVDITSTNGTLNLTVVDGIELNIQNKSTGANGLGPSDTRPGNINITSDYGDINLTSLAPEGAVIVQTTGPTSRIALQSAGIVEIVGQQGVIINSPTGLVNITGLAINLN